MKSKEFNNKIDNTDLNSLKEELLNEISNNKKDITPLLQLATVYKKTNELVKAVNLYITALDIDPENEIAIYEKSATQAIVAQSQLDIYACLNTHMDPWTD